MRGNIRQLPSGSWQLTVFAGRDAAGAKRYLRRTVRGTEEEARLALATFVLEVSRGEVPDDGSLTVAQALTRWLAWYRSQVSELTWSTADSIVRTHLVPALGYVRLDRLRTAHVDAAYAAMVTRKGQPLAPATAARVHAVLHRALGQAVRWGWIARNPADHASPPVARSAEIVPPDPAAVHALLERAEERDPMFAAWLRLEVATGARRAEVVGLRWDDVDFDRRQVLVRRAVIAPSGRLLAKEPKNRKARVVALDDETVAVLRRWRQTCVETALACGVKPGGYVLSPDPDGRRPMRPDGATSRFARLRKTVPGAASVRLHDLRHFIATQLLAAGVPVSVVADRLGHDPVVLLRRYGHFVPAKDREAAEVIGRLLRSDGRAATS